MTWYNPKDKEPAQGLSVLCMYGNECYVAKRYGKKYFSTMLYGSKYFKYTGEPTLWQYIDFPNNLTGMLFLELDGKRITLDEAEKEYPEIYKKFMQAMRFEW